jgi:NDP-sugar pyrophosphorylase family protein
MAVHPIQSAMVMTAGMGSRLLPFTQLKTKALLPVLGIPAAQFAVDSLVQAGVTQVVANVHHLSSQTKLGLSELDVDGHALVIKDESDLLLGTAGGIRNALNDLGPGAFFKANADVLCDLDWTELALAHQRLRAQQGVLLTLVVFPVGPRSARYPEILLDDQAGLITGIGKPEVGKPFWTGAAVIEPEAFSGLPSIGATEFVPSVLLPAIQQKKAGFFMTSGLWNDMGTPSLWLDTHFEMMTLFEGRNAPNARIDRWKKRFLESHCKLEKGIWAHRSSYPLVRDKKAQLQGRCYLGLGSETVLQGAPEHYRIGPEAVIYGHRPHESLALPWLDAASSFENGIAFGGHWMKK